MKCRGGVSVLSVLVVCLLPASVVLCAERQERAKNDEHKAEATSQEPARKPSLIDKLSRRVSVDTESDTLSNFIYKLSGETDINMVIDYGVLDNRQEIRLRKIRLRNIPVETALKVILRTDGLDYKVYEHFVFISTPARLRQYSLEELETRFYELKSAGTESLPKVALVNPAAMRQGGFGSITQLMIPVNPALVGGAPQSAQPR
ncbi:MAG: hypothetical protein KAJ01_02590 [Candidatus Hydrogenedentes bacterium]|nr:hypothetical protein [Candidatus Hydrogenedentota bacterium]